MAKHDYSIESTLLGGWHKSSNIILKLPSGKTIKITYGGKRDAASVEAFINEWIEAWGSKYGLYKRYKATRQRPPTYAQLKKKRSKSLEYTIKEIKDFFDSVYIHLIGGSIGSHKINIEDTAKIMLNQTLSMVNFNDYTGNLYNSYQATVVSNGKVTHVLRPAAPKKGLVFEGGRRKKGVFVKKNKKGENVKNPSRWSPLLTERHSPSRGAKLKENGKRIRYLNKYEKNPNIKGYSELGLSSGYSTKNGGRSPQLRIGRLQGSSNKGSGLIRFREDCTLCKCSTIKI